jgi:REP element-mobilizing transposase RayT
VKGHVGKDHVHLFVSVPPYLSVSKVMQYLKGKSSHKLLMEFAHRMKCAEVCAEKLYMFSAVMLCSA